VVGRAVTRQGDDPVAIAQRALAALDDGREGEMLPAVEAAAMRIGDNPLLWQCTGLLHRALGDLGPAIAAFTRAARLAPADAKIAQGHAQVELEAGQDAVAAFERARALNPGDGSVHLGLAAARFATGDAAGAIGELDRLLLQNPGWIEGHASLARLRWMMGERETAMASYARALAAQPRDPALWRALILALVEGERHAEALAAIGRARALLGDSPFFDANAAAMLSETGDVAGADTLFARVADSDDETLAVRRVRHLLRNERLDAALPLIDRWTVRPGATMIWPYASIAWRLAGDTRWDWLEAHRGGD